MTEEEHFGETDDGCSIKRFKKQKEIKKKNLKDQRFASCCTFWIVLKIEAV
jgi:hypothetical protein